MADYAVNNGVVGTLQAISSTYKSLLVVNAIATPRRGKLYDITFGTLGTPADTTYQFDVSRTTAAGTATATMVPAPLDPADAAASSASFCNYTGEPTYTAATSLFNLGINQRASYRWVAAPGSEMVWPATNLNGLGIRAQSASGTATATGAFLFMEQ